MRVLNSHKRDCKKFVEGGRFSTEFSVFNKEFSLGDVEKKKLSRLSTKMSTAAGEKFHPRFLHRYRGSAGFPPF